MAKDKFIWANLMHLGVDMWIDHPYGKPFDPHSTLQLAGPSDELQCDEGEWRAITDRMAAVGMNMLVIDLAEGLQYPSHPELAVRGSWTPDKMRDEIARLGKLGIEVVPKVNFSAGHDSWFKEYGRMLSTPGYYRFCSDIIADVAEIFKGSRFFHIGMDEEAAINQANYDFCVERQGDLWWHDLFFIVNEVEKHGLRPWMWSDYAWNNPDEFYNRCPKSVLQSNWYYSAFFDMERLRRERDAEVKARRVVQMHEIDQVECYLKLDKAGFDQIPCAGNWREDCNFSETVRFCQANLSPERLKGYLLAPWRRILPAFHEANMHGVELAGAAIRAAGQGGTPIRKREE